MNHYTLSVVTPPNGLKPMAFNNVPELLQKPRHVEASPLLKLSSDEFRRSLFDWGCLVEVCKDLSSIGGPKAASLAALLSHAGQREVEPDEWTPLARTESHEVSNEESSILTSFFCLSKFFSWTLAVRLPGWKEVTNWLRIPRENSQTSLTPIETRMKLVAGPQGGRGRSALLGMKAPHLQSFSGAHLSHMQKCPYTLCSYLIAMLTEETWSVVFKLPKP